MENLDGALPVVAVVFGVFAGFLASTRNGRGLLMHITSFEPDPAAAPALET